MRQRAIQSDRKDARLDAMSLPVGNIVCFGALNVIVCSKLWLISEFTLPFNVRFGNASGNRIVTASLVTDHCTGIGEREGSGRSRGLYIAEATSIALEPERAFQGLCRSA